MSGESSMSSGNSSSSSSAHEKDDMHNFSEEEEVSVSALKEEMLAEFRKDMESELAALRSEVMLMREEMKKLRIERDHAVNEAQKLQQRLESMAQKSVSVVEVRSPTRKIAKASLGTNVTTRSAEFPSLPSRPAPSAVLGSVDGINVNSNAYSIPPSTSRNAAASASASTSRAATASASTARKASTSSSTPAARKSNNSAKYKKIIQAINTDVFKVRLVLTASSVNSFSVKQTSKKGPVKIIIFEPSEVASAKAALVAAKISFHEFKTPDEKLRCFIVRGLVGATVDDLPLIRDELIGLGLPDSINVSLHVTGYMRANSNSEFSAPVKVVVPPGFDDKTLLDIKHLNHVAVRFELFKSKSIIQCKNCQGFGHSASGCQHGHKCVKCGEDHYRDTCPRTNNSAVKLRCVNCGGEHTANNLNVCPFFLERYGTKATTTASTQPTTTPSTRTKAKAPAIVQPGLSYARVTSINNTRNRTSANTGQQCADNQTFAYDVTANISSQLEKIMAKLEEHSLMWTKHDKCINILMSKFFDYNYE